MNGLWITFAAPAIALLDAATSHRARHLWTGIPAWLDDQFAAACDLGDDDA